MKDEDFMRRINAKCVAMADQRWAALRPRATELLGFGRIGAMPSGAHAITTVDPDDVRRAVAAMEDNR